MKYEIEIIIPTVKCRCQARTAGAIEEVDVVVTSGESDPSPRKAVAVSQCINSSWCALPATDDGERAHCTPSSPLRVSTPPQRTTSPVPYLSQLPSQYIRRTYLPSRCASLQRSSWPSKVLASFWLAERTSGKRRASRRPPPQRKRKMALTSRAVKRPRTSPCLMWAARKVPPVKTRRRLCCASSRPCS